MWPGHALAALGYRAEIARRCKGIFSSILIALAGGIAGALLVTVVSNHAFSMLIPFLLLVATLLFAFGASLSSWLSSNAELSQSNLFSRCLEFAIAVYGGFFGAGLGVMLMAGLLVLGVRDMQTNNALKNLLGAVRQQRGGRRVRVLRHRVVAAHFDRLCRREHWWPFGRAVRPAAG